jgi:hypothetical protein
MKSVRNSSSRARPSGVRRSGRHRLTLRRADHQRAGARVIGRVQLGQPRVLGEAREVRLAHEGRRRRVEGVVGLCEGQHAVMRQALPRDQNHLLQRLRRQPLHGVAVDVLDTHGWTLSDP